MATVSLARPIGIGELVDALVPPSTTVDRRFAEDFRAADGRSWPSFESSLNPRERAGRTGVASMALNLTDGDFERAEQAMHWLASELVVEMMRARGDFFITPDNMLIAPARMRRPPTVILLDPTLDPDASMRITELVRFEPGMLVRVIDRIRLPHWTLDVVRLARAITDGSSEMFAELLFVAQPEIIAAPFSEMTLTSAPWPCISAHSMRPSTIGALCEDAKGVKGVTACYHGTGPIGTQVMVENSIATVAAADKVQDLVFIPYEVHLPAAQRRGHAGVLRKHMPRQYQNASFWGGKSGATNTYLDSFSAGLLFHDPGTQLRFQTPACINGGDSGAALIDDTDHILGFAFRTSPYGAVPQFSDWIWAANALDALSLTPI